jgi:hypothetical protein
MLLKPRVREGAHWREPERQRPPDFPVFKRKGLEELTPTFGTAVPPRGLSGVLRQVAYDIPEDRVRHVLLLLLSDQVDVLESRLFDRSVDVLSRVLGVVGGSRLRGRRAPTREK